MKAVGSDAGTPPSLFACAVSRSASSDALRKICALPLPAHRYIPGKTGRHDEDAFDRIKDLADVETSSATAESNIAWLYGLRLIEKGFFWEAHEVLEDVWMRAAPNSREKHLVQGVIQIANAGLKIAMDRPNAAARLLDRAKIDTAEAFSGARPLEIMLLTISDIAPFLSLKL